MYRYLLIGSCLLLAGGCASSRGPSRAALAAYQQPTIAKECPTPTSEVPAERCADLPRGYGSSSAHPLEWGVFAIRGDAVGGVYYDRLICPDGTMAEATPIDFAPFTGKTTAVSSMQFAGAKATPSDLVDRFEFRCGGETATYYSNPYRCGSPCAPAGYRLLAADANSHLMRAAAHLKENAKADALREAEAARTLAPDVERTHLEVFTIQFRGADFEAAARTAREGLMQVPASTQLGQSLVIALIRLERPQEAEGLVDELLARFEERGDEENLQLTLQAKVAVARRLGRHDEAEAILARLCQEFGDQMSCKQPGASASP